MSAPGQVPSLVGVADVADLPGAPFEQRALDVASGHVRGACGWHIAPQAATTSDRDSNGGKDLVLPTLALREVTAVRDRARDTDLDGWEFSAAGILHRHVGWPRGLRAVHVEFVHGYDQVPLELVALVAELARAAASPRPRDVKTEVRTVSRVTTNRTYTDGGAVGSVLEDFEHVLDRYTVRVPV